MTCYFCERDTSEYPSVTVDFEGRLVDVCVTCMEKADEPERDEMPDLNREGLPEFNGAWVA